MASLCWPGESPVDRSARLSAASLKSTPVHIWWHRRRARGPAPAGDVAASPFPSAWSEGLLEDPRDCSASDASSVFSTASQEERSRRDEEGHCRRHPHVRLARRKDKKGGARAGKAKAKARVFAKLRGRPEIDSQQRREEWEVVRATCPECEKERAAAASDARRRDERSALAGGDARGQRDDTASAVASALT